MASRCRVGGMKDHEREFLVSCDLDPEADSEEVSRALAVYRTSGPWQRAENGLALGRLNAAVGDVFAPLMAKVGRLGRLVQRG